MIERLRPAFSAVLAVYALALASYLMVVDPGGDFGIEWLYLVAVLTAIAMGLFLAVRRPDNAIGTLISVIGAALMTNGVLNHLGSEVAEQGSDLATVLLVLASDGVWTVQFLCTLVLLPLWFPTGAPLNRRWAWVGRTAIGLAAVAWISFVLAEDVCVGYASPDSSVCVETAPIPWGIEGFPGLEWLLLIAMVLAVPSIVSLFVRWRRSAGIERQQLKWFSLAASGVALGLIASFDNFGLPRIVNDVISAVSLAGLWVAIAVAVLRYRLYEIDRLISRTISYALVVGVLGLVVLGLVTVFATFLPSDDPLVVAISTLAAAALFNPVRRRVQALIDRRFNRSRYDAQRVVGGFTETLRERVDPEEVVDGWVEVVEDTMQPAAVGVWVKEE